MLKSILSISRAAKADIDQLEKLDKEYDRGEPPKACQREVEKSIPHAALVTSPWI